MTSPASQLEELAARALIGTDRAGGAKAGEILTAAVVAASRARAGLRTAVRAAAVDECPPETLPVCSANAASILSRILAAGEWVMVEEWARLACSARRRVPSGLVPAVLTACESRAGLAYQFGAALGRCGEWLGGFNPVWRKGPGAGVPADLEARWATGTAGERREWLALARRTEPGRAIALVRLTWADDAASDRGTFVQILGIGLTAEDETFLESCLADRSKAVREAAAGLLCRLPESAYVGRMTARADRMLKLDESKKGLLKRRAAKWSVEPPGEWDELLAAHALEEKPPTGVGKRAWWLRQVVSAVPPAHWCAKTGLDAAELIAALEGNEYEKDVLIAWMTAAPRAGDVAWCRALAVHAAENKKGSPVELRPLWEPLAPEDRETVIADVIGARRSVWTTPWEILGTADHAWSEAFSRKMTSTLLAGLPSKAGEWWAVGPAIDGIRLRIHPALAAEFERLVEKLFEGDLPPSVGRATERLRMRAEMHRELST